MMGREDAQAVLWAIWGAMACFAASKADCWQVMAGYPCGITCNDVESDEPCALL